MSCRALVCGAVNGKFEAFEKRLKSVRDKAGPFAAVFIVGQLFADGESSCACPESTVNAIERLIQLDIPVYFIVNEGLGSEEAIERIIRHPSSSLQYLGDRGLSKLVGLNVAFLAGAPSPARAKVLIDDINKSEAGDIDLLLTSEWPAGATRLSECAPGDVPEGLEEVTAVVQAARPRYHFSCSGSVFYQREPYMNSDRGAGAHATRFISLGAVGNAGKAKWMHALALDPAESMSLKDLCVKPPQSTACPYRQANNLKKRKAPQQDLGSNGSAWAAKVAKGTVEVDRNKSVFVKNVPFSAEDVDVADFFSRAGEVAAVRWSRQDGKKASWLHVQFESEDSVDNACQLSGQAMMGRELFVERASEGQAQDKPLNMGQAVKDCWFCLSNDQADVQLVVDVGEEAYMITLSIPLTGSVEVQNPESKLFVLKAVDKGPISSTHILVLSVEHYPNSITLQPGAFAEMHRLIAALRKAYASRDLHLVGFERYLAFHARGGNHCHLNFIGIPAKAASRAKEVIEKAAMKEKFSFQHIDAGPPTEMRDAVEKMVQSGQYFQMYLPDGSRLVHPIARGEKHPMNFGREVLATLVGSPERADWRKCIAANSAEEEKVTQAFRDFFLPFNPSGAA